MKGISGTNAMLLNDMPKLITNTWKIIIKIRIFISQLLDVNNSYGWAMLRKLPINDNKWAKNTSQFTKYSIENYNEESAEGNFLEVDVQHPEKLHNLLNDLQLLFERIKIEKVEKLVATLYDKKRICCTYEKFKTNIKSWISI